MLEAVLEYHHPHPEIVDRQDTLLCSLNARLGALCRALGAEDPGEDLEPLGSGWLSDLLEQYSHLCQLRVRQAQAARAHLPPEYRNL